SAHPPRGSRMMRQPAAEAALPGDTIVALPVSRNRGFRYLLRRYARNRLALLGLWVVLLIIGLAVFAPWVSPYSPIKPDFFNILKAPDRAHFMGTDDLGRDVMSRGIFGTRHSLRER